MVVAIWVVCLIPVPETPLNDVCFIDKWTHFVMYGSLTTVIWFKKIKKKKKEKTFQWTVIWFEYLRKKRPLTRHCVTPSPQGARGEVCNGPLTKSNEQEMVTSSSPLGERMPEGQVRGHLLLGGVLCPIIMGGLIELAQAYLTTCRSGDFFDFVCNSLGVLLGCLVGLILKAILRG